MIYEEPPATPVKNVSMSAVTTFKSTVSNTLQSHDNINLRPDGPPSLCPGGEPKRPPRLAKKTKSDRTMQKNVWLLPVSTSEKVGDFFSYVNSRFREGLLH